MQMQGEYVKELALERVLDAPRERVWEAWTNPQLVAKWWVPKGMAMPLCELDVRPGGKILIHLSGYGAINPVKGVFQEVVEPERLVFTTDGYESVEAAEPVTKSLTTVTFGEAGVKTKLALHTGVVWTTPEAAQYLNGMEAVWTSELEALVEVLGSGQGA